ncbi:MAG: prepilin peptidase [Bradymonadaceae bacterium]
MEALLELQNWRTLLVLTPCAAVLLVAATTDTLHRKIPNWLTYPAFFVGLIVHTVAWGWGGLGSAIGAALLVFAVGFLLLLPGWMGGGDVKLLTGLTAFLGLSAFGEVMFYAIWVGFFLGIAIALINGYFIEMWRQIWQFFAGLVKAAAYQTRNVTRELETDERAEVPFGVAVFFGFVLAYTEATRDWPGLMDWFLSGM